jgi:hypothetical protein
MSTSRNRPLPTAMLDDDRTALIGLGSLSDYQPLNSAYSVARLVELEQTMRAARQADIRAMQALAAARDAAVATARIRRLYSSWA